MLFVEVNVCLYFRTCIFGLYMFIMIFWKNDAYSTKSESRHQTWHVGVGQVTSPNDRRHQPRLASIRRGMCASGKRRRQPACSISQGLHA